MYLVRQWREKHVYHYVARVLQHLRFAIEFKINVLVHVYHVKDLRAW